MHVALLTLQLVVGLGAANVRDSAGVRIVENEGTLLPEGAWRISTAPALRLGVQIGATDYEFFRINGLARFANGHIIVADGGSSRLLVFDAAGNLVTTSGREGGGPGEFTKGAPTNMWRGRSETIVTWDQSAGRLQTFDAAGAFVNARSIQRQPRLTSAGLPNPGAIPRGVGLLPDQGLVVFLSRGRPAPTRALIGEITRDSVRYGWYMPDGTYGADIGEFPANDWLFFPWNGRPATDTVPFGVRSMAGVSGEHLVFAAGDQFEFARWTMDGSLVSLSRINGHRGVLPTRAIDRYKQSRLAFAPEGEERSWRRWLDTEVTYPELAPSYEKLVVDTNANVWIQVFAIDPDHPRSWLVFDQEGRWLCRVELPPAFEPKDIGDDYILGVWRDALDVEYVHLYELNRGVR